MNNSSLFIIGVVLAETTSVLVVAYLHGPLYRILADLCGSGERATFWMAFSNVTIVLTPLLFALHNRPDDSVSNSVFKVADQLQSALLGLIVSVLVMGFVVGSFIKRASAGTPAKQSLTGAIQS